MTIPDAIKDKKGLEGLVDLNCNDTDKGDREMKCLEMRKQSNGQVMRHSRHKLMHACKRETSRGYRSMSKSLPGASPVLEIKNDASLKVRPIRDIWNFRGFILSSAKREFQLKYANSLFGLAWNFINPLAMILVYTIIFAQVMMARIPGIENTFAYSIFLCSGILTWGLFAEITTKSVTMFIENANLLKKLRFPRACLPAIVATSAILNFVIIFALFTMFLIISGSFPGFSYFAVIPLMALLVFFSIGLGMVLGVLNVFFRDVGQAFGIIITFWFWLTPIVYSPSILPAKAQFVLVYNPLAAFFEAMQTILVRGIWPDWSSLSYMVITAFFLCFAGLGLFRRHSAEMVDEL